MKKARTETKELRRKAKEGKGTEEERKTNEWKKGRERKRDPRVFD